jgi:iron complex outermembrane receptor protein
MLLSVFCLLAAAPAAAQGTSASDLTAMSLEDLLSVQVVSVASRFPQDVREAPASITVVTAQEIRRFGHRTLADVLRSVRGLYTTYDRNYAYIGIRGFSRPGDYNTRVLLLLDGQRLNDQVYDMAPIGTDFPVDVSLVDRVEVIRGPASSLYGTNAFLAVINVVTRTGALLSGLRVETAAGSLATRGATVSFGKVFRQGEMLVSASGLASSGIERLYYPEFDNGEPEGGLAVGLDGDEAVKMFGSMSLGRVSVRAGLSNRTKHVPTGSFDTAFNDPLHTNTDKRAYVHVDFDGSLGKGWTGVARAAYDYYGFEGDYPYRDGYPEPIIFLDRNDSRTVAGEITLRRRVAGRHLFSVGGEVRRQFRNVMFAADPYETTLDVNAPSTISGAYLQDEVRLSSWLLANAGLRLDHYPGFGAHVTPRAALVFLPRPETSVKLLYGRAFRAPNKYELLYYPTQSGSTLERERVHSTEVVWEEYVSSRVRTAVSLFTYTAAGIIEQTARQNDTTTDLYFVNAGRVSGNGFEMEVEGKLPGSVTAHAGYTYARVRNVASGTPFSNSPRHLVKTGVQVPFAEVTLGLEGQYVSSRRTLTGDSLAGVFLPNLTVSTSTARRVRLTVSLYNASNAAYSDPGAEEHAQASLPQDGRTAVARLHIRF